VYLPAYSPELQPQDHLFRMLRARVTHNHHWLTLGQLQGDVETFFRDLQRRPAHALKIIGSPFLSMVCSNAA